MSARTRLLLTSLITRHAPARCAPRECPCCRALRTALARTLFDPLPAWHSPLTPGVQRVNLTTCDETRTVHAALGRDWARMVSQLPRIGPVLVMTRNAAAILGRRMVYPALEVTRDGCKGASGEGGLWVDFPRLAMARAVHRRCEAGHIFGVEFADEEGRLIHRLTLTPESDFDAFFEWVRLHQACAAGNDGWGENESVPEAVEAPWTSRRTDAGVLAPVLAACRDRRLPVQAIVTTHGVRHGATFLPASFQRDGRWWFISDDWVGVHFTAELLTTVEVAERPDVLPGRNSLVLRCSSEEVDGALLLAPAPDTPLAEWHDILKTLA